MFLATSTVISAVAVFVVVILALVTILLQAKARLSPSGPVKLNINGDEVEVESGTTLLTTLSEQKIFLPSLPVVVGVPVGCVSVKLPKVVARFLQQKPGSSIVRKLQITGV